MKKLFSTLLAAALVAGSAISANAAAGLYTYDESDGEYWNAAFEMLDKVAPQFVLEDGTIAGYNDPSYTDATGAVYPADMARGWYEVILCNLGTKPVWFPAEVSGKAALVVRGDSTFTVKSENAKNAGAIACLVGNNCRAVELIDETGTLTGEYENVTMTVDYYTIPQCSLSSDITVRLVSQTADIAIADDALLSLDLRNAGLGGLMAATNSGFAKRGMVFYLSDVASTSGDAFEENYVVKRDVDFTSFARTFTGGKISTVCLPFAVYAGNDFGTFYEFKDCNDGKTVKFTKLTNGNTVANKAYLFKPNETAGDVKVIFETFSTAIDGLPELTEGDANGLYGVYTKKEFTPEEADRNIYYGWSAGNFVSIGAGATLSHGRAYLKVTAPQGGNAKDILKAIFDDETTGISEVNTTAADYNAPAYDLMGRRVGAGYKGIVIKNGKKVMPL